MDTNDRTPHGPIVIINCRLPDRVIVFDKQEVHIFGVLSMLSYVAVFSLLKFY